jgi:hypothetical protein
VTNEVHFDALIIRLICVFADVASFWQYRYVMRRSHEMHLLDDVSFPVRCAIFSENKSFSNAETTIARAWSCSAFVIISCNVCGIEKLFGKQSNYQIFLKKNL